MFRTIHQAQDMGHPCGYVGTCEDIDDARHPFFLRLRVLLQQTDIGVWRRSLRRNSNSRLKESVSADLRRASSITAFTAGRIISGYSGGIKADGGLVIFSLGRRITGQMQAVIQHLIACGFAHRPLRVAPHTIILGGQPVIAGNEVFIDNGISGWHARECIVGP